VTTEIASERESADDASSDGARTGALPAAMASARRALGSARTVSQVLIERLDASQTTTRDFPASGATLAPAGVFWSARLREAAVPPGAGSAYRRQFRDLVRGERERLSRRLTESKLWDAFTAVLAARRLDVNDTGIASPYAVAAHRARYGAVWGLDSGCSIGAPYSRSRLRLRFFPLSWEPRGGL
jgi:hypothetical protein